MSKLWCFTLACTRECFWKGLKPSLFSSHDKCPRSTLPHHCIVWHDLMSCCEVQATPPTLQTDKHCLVFAQVVPSTQIFVCSFAWTATEEENSKLIRGSWYIYMHRGSPGYSYPVRMIRESSSLIVCLQVSLWFLNISAAHFCTKWAASTADNERSLPELDS